MNKLLDIMRQLRHPETGCAWDKKQTFQSIFPYTLEEVYEVGDAIDKDDLQELKHELGDLLFQIVFYAQMAEEVGEFNFQDVIESISDKMVRRHPHIFSDKTYATIEEQKQDWERIKQAERNGKEKAQQNENFFADIAKNLTSLQRGQKVLKRAATIGFDWQSWKPIIDKIHEEVEEVIEAVENNESHERIEEEIGDLYIVVTNLARHLNVDAENAARKSVNKFSKRFNRMTELVRREFPDVEEPTLEQMDLAWELVKLEEKSQNPK